MVDPFINQQDGGKSECHFLGVERAQYQHRKNSRLAGSQPAAAAAIPAVIAEGSQEEAAAKSIVDEGGVVIQIAEPGVVAGYECRQETGPLAGAKQARKAIEEVDADRQDRRQRHVIRHGLEAPYGEDRQIE